MRTGKHGRLAEVRISSKRFSPYSCSSSWSKPSSRRHSQPDNQPCNRHSESRHHDNIDVDERTEPVAVVHLHRFNTAVVLVVLPFDHVEPSNSNHTHDDQNHRTGVPVSPSAATSIRGIQHEIHIGSCDRTSRRNRIDERRGRVHPGREKNKERSTR